MQCEWAAGGERELCKIFANTLQKGQLYHPGKEAIRKFIGNKGDPGGS
jgi:hypothetical protein